MPRLNVYTIYFPDPEVADDEFIRNAIKMSDHVYITDEPPFPGFDHHCEEWEATGLSDDRLRSMGVWPQFVRCTRAALDWCVDAIHSGMALSERDAPLVLRKLYLLKAVLNRYTSEDMLAETVACLRVLGEDITEGSGWEQPGGEEGLRVEDKLMRLDPESVQQYIERLSK